MKIQTSSLLFIVGMILLLASLPAEWFDLKNATITYPFDSGGTMPEMSVTGLNGFIKPFGLSTPIWLIVLVSEIGLVLGFCRSMKWADVPRSLCMTPLALSLATLVYAWMMERGGPQVAGAESESLGIGTILAALALILGLVALVIRSSSLPSATAYAT